MRESERKLKSLKIPAVNVCRKAKFHISLPKKTSKLETYY
jgi:hypothetical protein